MLSDTSFTNEAIDLDQLPKYEEILLKQPHSNYWKIICINLVIFFVLTGIIVGLMVFFVDEVRPNAVWIVPLYFISAVVFFVIFRLSFIKRGYAVRKHDVIYKSGIIAQSITIVPLKRIQHIELNEGVFSRMYKLGSLQLFTAGGQTGHIHISGIAIDEAKSMRDLLLKKLDLLENPTTETVI